MAKYVIFPGKEDAVPAEQVPRRSPVQQEFVRSHVFETIGPAQLRPPAAVYFYYCCARVGPENLLPREQVHGSQRKVQDFLFFPRAP